MAPTAPAATTAAPGTAAPAPAGSDAPGPQRSDPAATSSPVLLIGNPNVGKSVLFSALTRSFVTTANYPGTTVEITRGRATLPGFPHGVSIVDTPGITSLMPHSADERATRDLLLRAEPAAAVLIADAKNLTRTLTLLLQLNGTGLPLVLVLNMIDECREQGIEIDTGRLAADLGIPVVATAATQGWGIAELRAAIGQARPLELSPPLAAPLRRLLDDARAAAGGPRLAAALLALEWLGNPRATAASPDLERRRSELAQRSAHPLGYLLLQDLQRYAESLAAAACREGQPRPPTTRQRLGTCALHPVSGGLMLAAILYFLFWFVGLIGAGVGVDFLETVLFQQRLTPAAIRVVDTLLPYPHSHRVERIEFQFELPLTASRSIPLGPVLGRTVVTPAVEPPAAALSLTQRVLAWFHDLLVGPYGLFTMALTYSLAIVLPIVTSFFLVFSFLEDIGYLPRLALLLNRLFRVVGLNGKAVLPMVLGLGCDTMATMATRILETRRERLLTTLLLALGVPCSAQLGVLLAMTSRISLLATIAWIATIAVVLLIVGSLAARLLPGERTELILEIPPVRWPQPGNIAFKTLARLEWYLKEVIPLFMLGTLLLYLLDSSGLLRQINRLLSPVVSSWLGLPEEVTAAFLIGFLRRDYGAVYLLDAASGPAPLLDQRQILVAMVTITLFMPCIANAFVIWKEHSGRIALGMVALIFPLAFLVGGIVNHVILMLGLG